jgi:hypothetical protein
VGLEREGWTHSNIYKDSVVIDTYKSSTSMMFVLAMMRAHDITSDTKFVDAAADTYLALDKYLFISSEGLYSHSYDDIRISSDSLTYGLLYSILLNKEDSIERALSLIAARSKPINNYKYKKTIVTKSGNPILTEELKGISTIGSSKEIRLDSIDTLFPLYSEEIEDVSLTYILDSCLKEISKSRYVPALSLVSNYIDRLNSSQLFNRKVTSTILLSYCLDIEVVGNSLYKSNSLYDIETLLFHRRFYGEKISQIPKDYTWFDKSALAKNSVLGSLLYMLSLSLSNWQVGMRRHKNGRYLSTAKDKYLMKWGQDFSVSRKIQETQQDYADRIRSLMTLLGVTKDRLEEALLAQGVSINIRHSDILGIKGMVHTPYQSNGSLQGSNINPSTIYVEVDNHLSRDSRDYFESLLPIGTKALYEEKIFMYNCENSSAVENSYLGIEESIYSFEYEVLCCQKYDLDKPYFIRVYVEQTYSFPLYIYAYRDEESNDISIDIRKEFEQEGLVDVLKAGESSKLIKIEPYIYLPVVVL